MSKRINEVPDVVLTEGKGNRYYRLMNADDKVWLMPTRRMRMAMHLYQPGGKKGKLLKALFPYLHFLSPVRRLAHAEEIHCCMTDDLKALCSNLFQVDDLEYSLFCGTPGVHRKITIQLSIQGRILGYLKVTEREEIAQLFHREARLLQTLAEKQVKNIPACLYVGEWKGVYLFVQDTTKTPDSRLLHEWSEYQERFLEELHRVTVRQIRFEESDYYQTLSELKQHIHWLPKGIDTSGLMIEIDLVLAERSGITVQYSVYHADFTPWNMFLQDGHLFVFDWEYAHMTYPPKLDKYHFLIQSAIFEKRWGTDDIFTNVLSQKELSIDWEECKLYLLDMIARFTLREKGNVTGDVEHAMRIWVELLHKLSA